MKTFNLYGRTYRDEAPADGDPGAGSPPADDPQSGNNDPQSGNNDPTPAGWFDSVPETWRQDWVAKAGYEGEDATSVANMLERVADPATLLKNYKEAQDRIRKGEISNGLPENATDEQIAAYREANGIPPEPSAYQLQLEQGFELSDTQKEIFDSVFEQAHSGNVPNEVMSQMTNSFLKAQAKIIERQQQQDGIDAQQAAQVLKENWQGDYQTNINMIDGLLNQLPENVRDAFKGARMEDGRGVLNSPEIAQFLVDLARKANPAGAVVPNANNPVQAIEDEIAQLESRMGTPEWYKDVAANKRLEQLYEAQERMK